MDLTIANIECYLLVMIRISAFFFVAPFFSIPSIPKKVKICLSLLLTILIGAVLPEMTVTYRTELEFTGLIIKEMLTGLLIGYFSSICSQILMFVGQMVDMEIGFSMVNVLDPVSKLQVTVTGNYYMYTVMLMMLVSNLHHYLIKAVVYSFQAIPLGGAVPSINMYRLMISFLQDYFIIGFRIVLPVFSSILLVNIVLAILAKVAPQMNMFVVGMQLKVLIGLIVLTLTVSLLPSVAQFIMDEMKIMIDGIIKYLSST